MGVAWVIGKFRYKGICGLPFLHQSLVLDECATGWQPLLVRVQFQVVKVKVSSKHAVDLLSVCDAKRYFPQLCHYYL